MTSEPIRVFRYGSANGRPKLTARIGQEIVMMWASKSELVRLELYGDPAEGRVTVSRASRPELHALAGDSLTSQRPELFLTALLEQGTPQERAIAEAAGRVLAAARSDN